jgi:hypothetical protein
VPDDQIERGIVAVTAGAPVEGQPSP